MKLIIEERPQNLEEKVNDQIQIKQTSYFNIRRLKASIENVSNLSKPDFKKDVVFAIGARSY